MHKAPLKGEIHLALQQYLLNLFPKGEARKEVSFKQLGRIADIVWEKEKLVFEIQYSSISELEVVQRNRDYASIGYQVVWILHDRKYNKSRLTTTEKALKNSPHYFTNFTRFSTGMIYDQFSIIEGDQRILRMSPLEIDLTKPIKIMGKDLGKIKGCLWELCFEGDLLSLARKNEADEYLLKAKTLEENRKVPFSFRKMLSGLFKRFKETYCKALERQLKKVAVDN